MVNSRESPLRQQIDNRLGAAIAVARFRLVSGGSRPHHGQTTRAQTPFAFEAPLSSDCEAIPPTEFSVPLHHDHPPPRFRLIEEADTSAAARSARVDSDCCPCRQADGPEKHCDPGSRHLIAWPDLRYWSRSVSSARENLAATRLRRAPACLPAHPASPVGGSCPASAEWCRRSGWRTRKRPLGSPRWLRHGIPVGRLSVPRARAGCDENVLSVEAGRRRNGCSRARPSSGTAYAARNCSTRPHRPAYFPRSTDRSFDFRQWK